MTQVSRVSKVKFIQKGETGKPGPLLYPAGVWVKEGIYTRTDSTAPFVLYDTGHPDTDIYYYLAKEGVFTGATNPDPKSDHSVNGGTWKEIEPYDAIFTKILMANFALLAGAVFHDNKLMSQYGRSASGSFSDKYEEYVDNGDGKDSGNFNPNLLLNFVTGYLKARNVDITGIVNATGGEFGGFNIRNNSLVNSTQEITGAYIRVANGNNSVSTTIGYTGIIPVPGSASQVEIKNSGSGSSLVTRYALKISVSAKENYAISSSGSHHFSQPSSTHKWNAPGVLWAGIIAVNDRSKSVLLTKKWGDGITISDADRIQTGVAKIWHDLKHTDYIVQATPYFPSYSDTPMYYHKNTYIRVTNIESTYFCLRGVNSDNGEITAFYAMVSIIGRNRG
ncbi:MAG: hypothetical protein LUG98_01575 [Tannerellaceae bacterium]|nr:hypothetical protein [Tannerellaceae bacterium]